MEPEPTPTDERIAAATLKYNHMHKIIDTIESIDSYKTNPNCSALLMSISYVKQFSNRYKDQLDDVDVNSRKYKSVAIRYVEFIETATDIKAQPDNNEVSHIA
jgi:hypothetical protein